ncbi:MAG: ATP12 family protein [Zymomonas mobilis]|uniref:ATP12 family chaperone protein n=1 Tax=Zymomonas mobilis TaxID=542 RepID=UPI0001B7048B|nr:ATP12 family protein [Zymomonas mobilis]ACV75353.1 ATP12 ATPase [Zymomonas mobilis subsp. mobilis NCIMB 11163]AHB10138.1 chaperone required for the assembly of F1-ATPase [Zymomonas mobilis subsp. mobilis str. CP4 = NRRL B-14023]AHJ70445.1 ATP12 chaperone protein [Zymomonas mobilis subsp. mobilis NRRL B-12526]AHJ72300.1 ATP12 chaperone protein [Zymomonas mobilis subsp. mobilis str. CP4 = NRRL B-14023]MCP9307127.1 ATPase [Zymomonas mobilis]
MKRKRFYKKATVDKAEIGFAAKLDDRQIMTPARHPLILPTRALAEAVAEEWNNQPKEIDPASMPITGYANAAVDLVPDRYDDFVAGIRQFAESDVTCYRADSPQALVDREIELWEPLLEWAEKRFDIHFHRVVGIIHKKQPEVTLQRIGAAVTDFNHFEIVALTQLATISGSLVIPLAILADEITPEKAFDAAHIDEIWQAEQWGQDEVAANALKRRRRDFLAAARFFSLVNTN